MRKILVLTFLSFLFLSCTTGAQNFSFDNPKFNSMDEANTWVFNNIRYCWDKLDNWDKLHHWQSPQETLNKGTGICIDESILLASIMKYQKNYNSYILIVYIDNNTSHAIVECNSTYYDPTNNKVNSSCGYRILQTLTLDEALIRTNDGY